MLKGKMYRQASWEPESFRIWSFHVISCHFMSCRKIFRQADNDGELLQDMGQQLLLTGKYGSAAEFAKIIDAVKEEEAIYMMYYILCCVHIYICALYYIYIKRKKMIL